MASHSDSGSAVSQSHIRPEAIHSLPKPGKQEIDEMDVNIMFTSIMGMVAMYTKNRMLAWVGLFFLVQALARRKGQTFQWGQWFGSFGMCAVMVGIGILNDLNELGDEGKTGSAAKSSTA